MKRAVRIIVPIVLAVAILLCLAWYLFVYDRDFTRDMLVSGARFFENQGNHEIAEWFYDCAYAQAGDNDAVAVELAQQHMKAGNFTLAEQTLTKAIEDGGGVELYIALSDAYVKQDKIRDAVRTLDGIGNEELRAELDKLRPAAPVASPAPGFYSQYISVALDSDVKTIYAKNAAEYPSTEKDLYQDPITLEFGENTIYAVSVAENGLVSHLSVLGYTVGGVIEEVTFADAAMEAAIREALQVDAETKLFTDDLWQLESFVVPQGVKTLKDLQYLTSLTDLLVEKSVAGEFAYLSALTNLCRLTVLDTNIKTEELAVIGALPKLEQLTLRNCGLTTTSGLGKAVNLKELDLSGNAIRNIQALSTMSQLQTLYLQHNALTDLSSLSALVKLETLNVSYNSLTTLSPIATLTALNSLEAGHNQLTEVAKLDKLTALTHLILEHNAITDVSALAACTELLTLDISDNALTSIDKLSALNKMTAFDFSRNKVTALPKFAKTSALVTIDGSHNQISSLDPLSGLKKLNNVYMDYNANISSVKSLASCPLLIQVNVYGTKVKDVKALTDQSVKVNHNPT